MQPIQVEKPKRDRGKKANDSTTTEPTAQSTALVVTCSATKAATEVSAAHFSAVVGSPSAVPSMVLVVASQSEVTVLSLRKRKVMAPNVSITSFGSIPISVLMKKCGYRGPHQGLSGGSKTRPCLHLHIRVFNPCKSLHHISLLFCQCILNFVSHIKWYAFHLLSCHCSC